MAGCFLFTVSLASLNAAQPRPNFYRDVLPILQAHCQSCHRPGEIAPFPLMTHRETRPWAQAIGVAIESRKMPPWFADPCCGHFSNDPSLTPEQISTIVRWAENGAPEGNAKDKPAPVRFPREGTTAMKLSAFRPSGARM